jgi:hypothetical protein
MDDLGFTQVENNETYWIGCQRTGGLLRRSGLQGGIRHDRYGMEEPVRGDSTSANGRRGVKSKTVKTGGVDMGEARG